jgi:GalNAc-alpha-(1->4)-GalNAc-alpha-(1->3)-diNAcBac-PP-undecaprenol alpha-1,4-N-acetyl-D-galactosaminyltransferase
MIKYSTKKSVVFVIPALNPGGMQRVMSELVNYYSEQDDIYVHLVLYGKTREMFYNISDKIILYRPKFNEKKTNNLVSILKTLIFIRRTILNIQPESVLSFGEIWNNLVLISLFKVRIPIYISDRCKPDKSFGKINGTLRKLLYPTSTGVIAQTQKAKELYHKQFLHKNISVIGNPIRLIKTNQTIERENIIISVGRLIETKNFDRLIRIFSQLKSENWKLVIVGGNALNQNNMPKLKQLIFDLGIENKVLMTGGVKNVDEYLLRSKIFAFTSSSEGFPNVIGEAMSAGLPVVSYDCLAGPSEMIENGENGFLVPLYDDEMFKEKLEYLVANQNVITEFGQNAQQSIKKYSVEIIAKKYKNILLNL